MLLQRLLHGRKASGAGVGLRIVLACLVLCMLGGCYDRQVDQDQATYRFAGWLIYSIVAACVIAVPVGWRIRKLYWKIFPFVCFMVPVTLGLLLPSMIMTRIVIDDDRLQTTGGIWFTPNRNDVRFDEASHITYALDPEDDKRRRYDLNCHMQDGQVVVVNVGDLMKMAIDEVVERARQAGVRVDGYPAN